MRDHSSPRCLFNLATLSLCLLIVAALLAPAIAQQRQRARSFTCANNLKQMGLAFHNYHSAYKVLPSALTGTDGGATLEQSNQGRLSAFVAISPFAEHQALWEKISNPYTDKTSNQTFPSMGPVPWYDANVYKPWGQVPSFLICADSEPAAPQGEPRVVFTLASKNGSGVTTSYVVCHGDGTLNVGKRTNATVRSSMMHSRATKRGLFVSGESVKFRDCLDGLANTLMVSETQSSVKGEAGLSGIAKGIEGLSKNPSLCLKVIDDDQVQWWDKGRGSRWCDGQLVVTGFQTVLPPNSPSCTSDLGIDDAITSVSSHHPGGAHALMADGRVVFISNEIDTGDSTSAGVAIDAGYLPPGSESPYGIWGALGTRASKETLNPIEQTDGMEDLSEELRGNRALRAGSPGNLSRWTSRDGQVTLQAEMTRIIDKKTIELKDRSGVLHRVPLNTLRNQDIFRAVRADLRREP